MRRRGSWTLLTVRLLSACSAPATPTESCRTCRHDQLHPRLPLLLHLHRLHPQKGPSNRVRPPPPPPPSLTNPLCRVIYNPFLSQLYSAISGHGAFLNHTTRLPLTHPSPLALAGLSDALIAVEWGSDRSQRVMEKKGRTFAKLAGDGKEIEGGVMAHSLRSIG